MVSEKHRQTTVIDEYLKNIPEKFRKILEELLQTIRKAAPEAEEVISWQMPAFKQKGILVGFAAFKDHCSFFPYNSKTIELFKDDLKDFSTSKGTIRFTIEKPLPVSLVKKIVKYRIVENETKFLKKK